MSEDARTLIQAQEAQRLPQWEGMWGWICLLIVIILIVFIVWFVYTTWCCKHRPAAIAPPRPCFD